MKHLKIVALLLLIAALVTPAIFNRIVNSQSGQDPNPETNQADKVSGTGFPVTASQGSGKFPIPNCGDVDCESVNPFDESTFIFTAGAGDRPPAADQCVAPCPSCPVPQECGDDGHALEAPADFSTDSNGDRKSTRLNSSHPQLSRMPSSA